MNNEKIIHKIQSKTAQTIAEINQTASAQAEAIISAAQSTAAQIMQQHQEKAKKEVEQRKLRLLSRARIDSRIRMLAEKKLMIQAIFNEAAHRMEKTPTPGSIIENNGIIEDSRPKTIIASSAPSLETQVATILFSEQLIINNE